MLPTPPRLDWLCSGWLATQTRFTLIKCIKNNCAENVFDIYPSLSLVLTDLNYIRSHFLGNILKEMTYLLATSYSDFGKAMFLKQLSAQITKSLNASTD